MRLKTFLKLALLISLITFKDENPNKVKAILSTLPPVNSILLKDSTINNNFIFGTPKLLVTLDSFIIIYDPILKNKINIFSKKGKLLNSIIEKGNKKNQIQQIMNLGVIKSAKTFIYLYDNLNKKILYFDPEDKPIEIKEKQSPKLTEVSYPNEIHHLNEIDYLYVGSYLSSRFFLYRENHCLYKYNEYPNYKEIGNWRENKSYFTLKTSITLSPSKKKIASVSQDNLILEIFDITDTNQIIKKETISLSKVQSTNEVKNSVGFSKIYSTDSYIYTVLGFMEKENREYKPNYKNLFVFGWNGELITHLKSDINIYSFTVDTFDRVIYAIGSKKSGKKNLYKIY